MDLNISLSENHEAEFESFAKQKTQQFLDASLDIVFEQTIKKGLKIEPKEGGYIISFTDDDFSDLFQNYLKDKNKNLIFG